MTVSNVTIIAIIAERLQQLKAKIEPSKWAETPLPVIAAPRSWVDDVRAEFGGGEPEDFVLDQIHDCKVVVQEGIEEPCLIDHDGKVYRLVPKVALNPVAEAAAKVLQ